MNYSQVIPAHFLSRPNRFVAQVEVDGQVETVHVKNTGRCRELLIPGRTVYLTPGNNPKRKTPYDLIAVDKDGLLINMDAQAPNQVFAEWAGAGHFVPNLTLLRPETTWGHSRFDFYWEGGAAPGLCGGEGVHPGGKRPLPLPRRPHRPGSAPPPGAHRLSGPGL